LLLANDLHLIYTVLMQKLPNQFRDLLNSHNLKSTTARLAVLQVLSEKSSPLSALLIANKIGKSVDQATIYRTLESFIKLGLVKRVDLQRDEGYFELSSRPDHHHITCSTCGKIEDFVGCHAPEIIRHALKQSKFFKTISEHSLELFGQCANCQ
jgi:Fe2+ or Zn2+ uptake regulation protein